MGKESVCNAGDPGDVGLIPEVGRVPGGGNSNPLPAWKIPWTEVVAGYSPKGHKELDMTDPLSQRE